MCHPRRRLVFLGLSWSWFLFLDGVRGKVKSWATGCDPDDPGLQIPRPEQVRGGSNILVLLNSRSNDGDVLCRQALVYFPASTGNRPNRSNDEEDEDDETRRYPILYFFHGDMKDRTVSSGSWERDFETNRTYGAYADGGLVPEFEFVLVVPQGTRDAETRDGSGNGWEPFDGVYGGSNDVVFVRLLHEALLARPEWGRLVDPRFVFASGHSSGGALSLRLALRAPDVFLAVAPHAGRLWAYRPNDDDDKEFECASHLRYVYGGLDPHGLEGRDDCPFEDGREGADPRGDCRRMYGMGATALRVADLNQCDTTSLTTRRPVNKPWMWELATTAASKLGTVTGNDDRRHAYAEWRFLDGCVHERTVSATEWFDQGHQCADVREIVWRHNTEWFYRVWKRGRSELCRARRRHVVATKHEKGMLRRRTTGGREVEDDAVTEW